MTSRRRRWRPPDLVTDAIRQAILGGVLAPGEQLVERVIADQLGVSKTPVPEALRSLEASGLLESYPSRGVVVRQANAKLVQDLYDYRLLLEPAAVEWPCRTRINRSFHEGLYDACRMNC